MSGSSRPVLMRGSIGPHVAAWRTFLRTQKLDPKLGDTFDLLTEARTRDFQERENLAVIDGVVGQLTWTRALALGPDLLKDLPPPQADPDLPKMSRPRLSERDRRNQFGQPSSVLAPTATNPENIRLTNDDGWLKSQIVSVTIPQLRGIAGAPPDGVLLVHKLAAKAIANLFSQWEKHELLPHILTFDGGFNTRLTRSNPVVAAPKPPHETSELQFADLSTHALGIAFDINAAWNLIGQEPARRSQIGCVYDLVAVAQECGFWWGGFDANRPEGGHFEFAEPTQPKSGATRPTRSRPRAKRRA